MSCLESEMSSQQDLESEVGGDLSCIIQYLKTPELLPKPPMVQSNSRVAVFRRRNCASRTSGKRSKKACASCRSRKVRCNVDAHGIPCSNCQHDEVECTIPSRYKRKPMKRASSSHGPLERPDDGRVENLEMTEDGGDLFLSVQPHISNENSRDDSETCARLGSQEPLPSLSLPSPRMISLVQSSFASESEPVLSTHPASSLAEIFTPFPAHLGARELTYLKLHDALTLPSEEFQVELLQAYIEFAHGTLPVIDLADFLAIVKFGNQRSHDNTLPERSPANQVSLLLFQAVMFAAVGYVSSRVLQEAGFESRKIAKKTFFNRVKLLYNFDICTDRLATVQSLLLMTLCPTNRTSSQIIKDAGHFLGIAISLAFVLGLNRDIYPQTRDLRRKHLERRIWWIAFIRDRTLSLRSSFGLRRRVQIAKEDSHIEMLSLEDFNLEDNTARYEGIDELRMKVIAVECVEKAMMCWCSNEDVAFICSVNSSKDESLSQPLYQSPTSLFSREVSEQPNDDVNDSLRKDERSFPFATHFQKSPLHDRAEAEPILSKNFDKKELFRSTSGTGIISEYDDYFEYLQEPREENNEDVTQPSSSDGTGWENETFAFGFNYGDERLEIIL